MPDFIHNDPEFKELLNIVSLKKGIDITLIEKDYWIMHALYSLQQTLELLMIKTSCACKSSA